MFVRPVLLRDWAWMLTTFDYLLVAGLLLALLLARRRSGSSRQGAVAGAGAAVAAVDSSALWCWWSRWAVVPVGSCMEACRVATATVPALAVRQPRGLLAACNA